MKKILFILFILVLSSCVDQQQTSSVTDIEGNVYNTVKIGDQWWMAENLIVTKYRNGDEIPNVVDGLEWSSLSTGAYSIFENDPSFIPIYSLHYNWFAAVNSSGICPEGWHVPTDEDWMDLEVYLGISQDEIDTLGWRGTDAGGKLKDTDPDIWETPLVDATNETGFSARPGGGRASDNIYGGGFFYQMEHLALWSSDEYSSDNALYRVIEHDQSGIARKVYIKTNGFNIRCVKD